MLPPEEGRRRMKNREGVRGWRGRLKERRKERNGEVSGGRRGESGETRGCWF